jgi:hypothetical protein
MDRVERHVEKHLLGQRHKTRYEPDGNVPPDFLVDNTIAVEVRRLNEYIVIDGEGKGLEELAIPLHKQIVKILGQIDAQEAPGEHTWYLSYRYKNKPPDAKTIAKQLPEELLRFLRSSDERPRNIVTIGDFRLNVIDTVDNKRSINFLVVIATDENSGGFVVEIMADNIARCVDEKNDKVEPYRAKYSEWWLVLVDYVAGGLDEYDKRQLLDRLKPNVQKGFDKVRILHPEDSGKFFDLS